MPVSFSGDLADRISCLEAEYKNWDLKKVRSEEEEIESALDVLAKKTVTPNETDQVNQLKERVHEIRARANMAHAFDEPEKGSKQERVSSMVDVLARSIFFGICWGIFMGAAMLLRLPGLPFASLPGLVFTLHMIIQSI
jgi:hypothetical protein